MLGVKRSSSVNESPRKQAGGWLFLPVRLLIANQTFVPPSPATVAGRAAAALEGAGGPSGAGLPVRSAKPWPETPSESWHRERRLILIRKILRFWEPFGKNVSSGAQVLRYVKWHSAKPKYLGEKTHSQRCQLRRHALAPWPAPSWHSSSFDRLTRLRKSFPLPPPSSSPRRFHALQLCSKYFIFTKETEFTGRQGDTLAGGHIVACKSRKVARDAWARPRLRGWGCYLSEADIIWGGSMGKGSERPSGFVSDLLWALAERRAKAGRPERPPCFPAFWQQRDEGQSAVLVWVLCSVQQQAKDRAPTPFPRPPSRPSFTSLQKDSAGKSKRRCRSWQGPRGSTVPLLPSSLAEQTFVFSPAL